MNSTHTTCSCGCTGSHTCDCCTGPHVSTPHFIFNAPGLDTIQRRVGTWGSFRSTMQARLSSFADFPAMRDLTTREPDDPSMAFLDATAVVCDVLTFYSERFANEGYLRTATQRRSLMELGKLVGYKPRPGVAASAWLAFTLDRDYAIEISAGTRVQSVPSSPGETAQTFETTDSLSARHELNAMPARRSVPQEISPANVLSIATLYFKGTGLNLKAGDMLLFVFPSDEFSNTPRKVHTVTEDSTNSRTAVKLVVEKLSAAYFLPVLKKNAQALRKSLPESVSGAEAWIKDAAEALDRFTGKLGADTSLLDMEAENDAGLAAYLSAVTVEGNAAKEFIAKLPARTSWTQDVRSALKPVLDRAAAQERLLLAVFAQMETMDVAGASLAARRSAAAQISSLLAPGGAVDACFQPVLSTLRALLPIAAAASAAATDAAWSNAGMDAANPDPHRAAVENLGYDGSTAATAVAAAAARVEAMSRLAAAAVDLNVDANMADAAGVLFDSTAGSIQEVINQAATPEVIKNALTMIQTALRDVWSPLESMMSTTLSLGNPADTQLSAAASRHRSKVADITAAGTSSARTTAMLALATESTQVIQNSAAHLAFVASVGTQAAALVAHQEGFRTESVAGFENFILLLAGRYESGVAGFSGVAVALAALKSAAGGNATNTLAALHTKLLAVAAEVETELRSNTSTTLQRLRAELGILSGQVSVSPSGSSSVSISGTAASGAALGKIVTGTTLLQPSAPGDPLAVERSLGAFVSGRSAAGGVASDAVSRLAAKLAGSTEDDLFAAWRKLNTGTPAVEIYAMRVQSAVFGAGAPMRFSEEADKAFSKRFGDPEGDGDWSVIAADIGSFVRLDGEQNKVVRESYVVIERPLSVALTNSTAIAGVPSPMVADAAAAPSAGGAVAPGAFPALNLDLQAFLPTIRFQLLNGTLGTITHRGEDNTPYTTITEARVRRVQDVSITPHSAYSLSGKATTVSLLQETGWGADAALGFGVIRSTKVYAASELLTLDEQPVDRVVGLKGVGDDGSIERTSDNPFSESDDVLMLDGLYQGLAAGTRLLVAGERSDDISVRPVREYALVSGVEHVLIPALADPNTSLPGDTPHTRITLSKALQYQYQRSTLVVYGNVAEATHGETKRETLGSGNARAVSQRFSLRSTPLTYVAAATASGAESTAELRVDRVLWREVEQFTDALQDDRVYMLDIADDGTTQAVFGDGKRGARLPTGVENVAAVYRQGIGQAGNVGAETMTTLLDRPLGLKQVINPLAASGGADRDTAEHIRTNAPLPLLALDRLVSVSDYAAFSRAFAGIAKAEAALIGGAGGSFVHVTIAGQDDALIAEDSSLMSTLTDALILLGDPLLPVRVQSRELLVLLLSAGVRIAPEYAWADVEPALRAAVLATFGFDRRAPGQDVFLSEVIAVMHCVPGVDYVDVDSFGGIPEKQEALVDGVAKRSALTPEELETAITNVILLPGPNPPSDPPQPREPKPPEQRVTVNLAGYDPLGTLRPAQLALFLSDMPETLILNQLVS